MVQILAGSLLGQQRDRLQGFVAVARSVEIDRCVVAAAALVAIATVFAWRLSRRPMVTGAST